MISTKTIFTAGYLIILLATPQSHAGKLDVVDKIITGATKGSAISASRVINHQKNKDDSNNELYNAAGSEFFKIDMNSDPFGANESRINDYRKLRAKAIKNDVKAMLRADEMILSGEINDPGVPARYWLFRASEHRSLAAIKKAQTFCQDNRRWVLHSRWHTLECERAKLAPGNTSNKKNVELFRIKALLDDPSTDYLRKEYDPTTNKYIDVKKERDLERPTNEPSLTNTYCPPQYIACSNAQAENYRHSEPNEMPLVTPTDNEKHIDNAK